MHAFGRRANDDESSSSSSEDSMPTQTNFEQSTATEMSTSSDDSAMLGFGKKSGKVSGGEEMARIQCAAKLGFFAGIIMLLLGYLSVAILKMDTFQKEDPVSRKKVVDWQKLSLYAAFVFLVVSIGSYVIAGKKN